MRMYVHQEGKHEADAIDAADTDVLAAALEIGSGDGLLVLIEDRDQVLDITLTVEDAGGTDRMHVFRGRRSRIEVVVSFNGERREREFATSARVDRVFHWATGEHGFGLSKADAAEHTLALTGSNVIPAGDVHIGSLDQQTPGQVAFSLIPKHRYEG